MSISNLIVAKCDDVFHRSRGDWKLPAADLEELAKQFNVNQCDGCDDWFDSDELPEHVRILTEAEMLETYL